MLKSLRRWAKAAAEKGSGPLLQNLPLAASLALAKHSTFLRRRLQRRSEFVFDRYLGNLKISINTVYPIEREVCSGLYDRPLLKVIQQFVAPGSVCLDIGANIGAISLALAQQSAPNGKVFAFEPGPFLFERLCHNCDLNDALKNVITPVNLGLSDKTETLYWEEDQQNRGNAGFLGASPERRISLQVTSLDEWVQEQALNRIDFVKIDVEGMEWEVIQGGLETWKRFQPTLYYETLPAFEEYRKEQVFLLIERKLTELGYQFFKQTEDFKLVPTKYPDLSSDTLAIPQHAAAKLQQMIDGRIL